MLAAALLATACARPPGPEREDVVQVAASVPPQAYFVDRIGGARVAVEVMVPPASSPATYEPTPRQRLALARARLYFKVGHPDFPFEHKHLDRLLESRDGIEVVALFAGLSPLPSGAGGESDPHVWLSPPAVTAAAAELARALVRIDPAGRELYEGNLAAFLADVEAVDGEIAAILAGRHRRRFLVVHPAWGYFAAHYGLEQVAIEHGGKEPGAAALVELVERARREEIRVVFAQKGFSDRAARVIAREIGARVAVVDPLAYDWLANLREVAAVFQEALQDG